MPLTPPEEPAFRVSWWWRTSDSCRRHLSGKGARVPSLQRVAYQPEPAPKSFGPVMGVPLFFGPVAAVSAFSLSVGHD